MTQNMNQPSNVFSYQSRQKALARFKTEIFDCLIIGGGITGAATARDAASRGLKVALVEKRDFAWGTSSRSSRLIHGGLRYLENMEFSLVFEALRERTHLLKTAPHLVKPLAFYSPIYKGDRRGKFWIGMGMWLYDVLSLFQAQKFHRALSRREMLKRVPFLKKEGLKGGFRFFDASMWDDMLTVETLRSAQSMGVAIANYVEASQPIWKESQIVGFNVIDREEKEPHPIEVRAKRVIVCTGPWTDLIGDKLSRSWRPWLKPSQGIHLIFDLKKLPIPAAFLLSHPSDGRISFAIPRPDYGTGVTIVGTTDTATSQDPEKAKIERKEVIYLMDLLHRYFPGLQLKTKDIISGYVGVRPLIGPMGGSNGSGSLSFRRISREHFIGRGPGETIVVAGGKFTTHRTMAEEIVDYTVKTWEEDAKKRKISRLPKHLKPSQTKKPVNLSVQAHAIQACQKEASKRGWKLPEKLLDHYGSEALEIMKLHHQYGSKSSVADPEGFPLLQSQFRYALRQGMVMHLEDFYLRRLPLFLSREDHGLPWAEALSQIWAEELGKGTEEVRVELERLQQECQQRLLWKKKLIG